MNESPHLDVEAMRRKLDAYGVFSLADAELLLAEVARLRGLEQQATIAVNALDRCRFVPDEARRTAQAEVGKLAALLATPEEPNK